MISLSSELKKKLLDSLDNVPKTIDRLEIHLVHINKETCTLKITALNVDGLPLLDFGLYDLEIGGSLAITKLSRPLVLEVHTV